MDQKIGIEFSSTGADKIIGDTRRLNKSLGTVVVTVNSLTTKLGGFQSNIGKIASATKEAAAAMEESAAMAAKAAKSGEQVAASMQRSQNIVRRLRREAGSSGAGVSRTGRSRAAAGSSGMFGMPLGLGRITGAAGVYGGYAVAHDVVAKTLFGSARADIVDSLRNMATMGYTKDQLRATEAAGDKYLRQNWMGGGIKDYLEASTEVASAWNPNLPIFKGKGQEANVKMTETVMDLAAGTDSKDTKETAQLLNQTVKSQLTYMGKSESDKYLETGEKSLTAFTEKTAGQLGEVVANAMVWGPDMKHLLQKAVPTAMGTGWSLSNLAGIFMGLRSVGAGSAQAATSLNTLLNKDVLSLALLQGAGSEDPAIRALYKSMTPAQQMSYGKERVAGLQKQFAHDPFGMMRQMQDWFKRADAEGYDLKNSFHVGLRSLAALRPMLSSERFLKEAEAYAAIVDKVEGTGRMRDRNRLNAGDPGYTERIWDNASGALWRAASTRTGKSDTFGAGIEIIDNLTDMLRSPQEITAKSVLKATQLSEAIDGFSMWMDDTLGSMLSAAGKAAGVMQKSAKDLKASEIINPAADKIETALGSVTGNAPAAKVPINLSTFDKIAQWFGYDPLPKTDEEAFAHGEKVRKAIADKEQAKIDKKNAFWGPVTDGYVTAGDRSEIGSYVTHWGSHLFDPPKPMAEINGTIPTPKSAWDNVYPVDEAMQQREPNITVQPAEVKVESRVYISENELRDVITEVLDRALRQDGQGFGTGGAGYSYGSS